MAGKNTSYNPYEALQKYEDSYGFVDSRIVVSHSKYQAAIKEVEELKLDAKEMLDQLGKSKVIPITKWDEFSVIEKHLEQNPRWEGTIQVVTKKNAEGQRLKERIMEALGNKFGSRVEVIVKEDKY